MVCIGIKMQISGHHHERGPANGGRGGLAGPKRANQNYRRQLGLVRQRVHCDARGTSAASRRRTASDYDERGNQMSLFSKNCSRLSHVFKGSNLEPQNRFNTVK